MFRGKLTVFQIYHSSDSTGGCKRSPDACALHHEPSTGSYRFAESRSIVLTIDLAENYSGKLKSFTGESEHGMNDSRQLMY